MMYWTLKIEGCILFSLLSFGSSYVKAQESDEPEPEHDALQVLEDPAWLIPLPSVSSHYCSRWRILDFHSNTRAKKAGIMSTTKESGQTAYHSRSEYQSDPWSASRKSTVGLGRDDV
jgi:hypothetical protein